MCVTTVDKAGTVPVLHKSQRNFASWHLRYLRGVFRINAPDKLTSIQYTLHRWRKNKYFGDGYSLSGSFLARTAQISRLTSSRSKRLRNRNLLQSGLWWRRIFLPLRAPGLQKVGGNKTVGRQYFWGQYHVDHSNKLYHQSCWRQKNAEMTKRTAEFMVAVVAAIRLVWRLNCWCSFCQEGSGLWLCPSRFSSRKGPDRYPRASFCGRTKKQTLLAPH